MHSIVLRFEPMLFSTLMHLLPFDPGRLRHWCIVMGSPWNQLFQLMHSLGIRPTITFWTRCYSANAFNSTSETSSPRHTDAFRRTSVLFHWCIVYTFHFEFHLVSSIESLSKSLGISGFLSRSPNPGSTRKFHWDFLLPECMQLF